VSSVSGTNLAASIRARLLRLAQVNGEDYQRVLGRYGIERFLYRLGYSLHRDRFALKGATLFTLWTGQAHRPTKDLDLLGRGSSAIDDVEAVMREICAVEAPDGIVFDAKSVEGTKIKEDDEYDGVRIKFDAHLAGARIPMQVDIGFGDAVYPEPELATFPVLVPMSAPQIRAYPRESAIAEKLHAMVELDIRNSRMKDFYDIWYMAKPGPSRCRSYATLLPLRSSVAVLPFLKAPRLRSPPTFGMIRRRSNSGMPSSADSAAPVRAHRSTKLALFSAPFSYHACMLVRQQRH